MENSIINILIVEDSPTQAVELHYLLEKNHYQVTVAHDGGEALEILKQLIPTIIISDIIMPGMNGYELCNAIKENDRLKDIPVILLTSLSDPDDVINGLICGANNFIVKPYDEQFLLSRIKYILANKEIRKTAFSQMGIEIIFRGKRYFLNSERVQMIDLLLSTYEAAIQRNTDFQIANEKLQQARDELEMRVEERTAELLAANVELHDEILKRKQAQADVIASEIRYRRLFEAAKDGILILDGTTGHIIDVNPYLIELLGYPQEAFLGQELWNIGMFKDIADSKNAMEELFTDGYIRYDDLPLQTADGRRIEVEFVSNVYMVDQKRVIQCNIRDITDRKQLEEQLQQTSKMEAIGRLAGGVAHDFNNALTPIIAISDLLLNQLDPEHLIYRDIKEMQEAGERCVTLTRQLLAFGRRQTLDMKVLNLNDVVITIEKMLSRVIGEDIEVVKFLAPNLGRVKADVGQLEQIIVNLAVNSRDAMPTGGKLTIETANITLDEDYARTHHDSLAGHHVMLAVSDTGIGMDEQIRAHIFEPFFTTKEKGKGTGLGLSTVYGIVKQTGGNIWVYSEPGKGTTFKIYLPRVEEAAERITVQERISEDYYRGSETVLLVEDEDSVRMVVKRILEKNGYTILEAPNSEEAIKICDSYTEPIHLIFTDVVMPGMSGKQMVEHLMPRYPAIKVIYASGYTDDAIVHHGVLEKGTNFIQKPFTTEALTAKIRTVLDNDTDNDK